jgi:hypothetical protein
VHGKPLRDGVVFVDLAGATDLEVLRNVDPAILHQEHCPILLRAELGGEDRDAFLERARRMFERWGLPQGIALVEHPVGEAPMLTQLHGPEIADEDRGRLLRHARLVELHALLDWGQAIWRPKTYHYLLPSGEHASEYIRLADAIREPRDAEVLASWLNRSLVDRMGFVIDTGVLNPVVLALIRNLERAGWRANPVAVLDQYPRSSADVDAALDVASGREGNVLALLSISSSGAVLDRLYTSLERKKATLGVTRLEVLIRKSNAPLPPEIEVWSPLPGEEALVGEGTTDATCELCRSPERARICPISPRTLDEMLPSQLRMTSPSVAAALANKGYWQIADEREAVRVEAHPHPAIGFHRPQKISMPIAVRLDEILETPTLADAFVERVKALHKDGLQTDPDLVLAPQHELEFPGYREIWQRVGGVLAPSCEEPSGYPVDGQGASPELAEKIRSARGVLVFCLGLVSGVLLQRGLLVAQSARDSGEYRLQGLVLHARPASAREWEGLTNAYGDGEEGRSQLFIGWKTLLPDRSPLQEELSLLQELDESKLDPEMLDFREERIRLCGGGSGAERPPLFWGSRDDDRLTPNAIFGERLSARSAYAAVGAAMEEARAPKAEDASPEYRVFELAAIFRSYYDPLLVAAILRWLRPHEAWWGWQWSDSERAVSHLVGRMPLDLRRIVVAELLLAASQGKLGPAAIPHLRAFAQNLLPVVDGRENAAIRLGLHIAPKPTPTPATKG